MKRLAPIAYFTYNRPEHTKISLEALNKNELAEKSEILIFSDGAKNNDLDKKKLLKLEKLLIHLKVLRIKKLFLESTIMDFTKIS